MVRTAVVKEGNIVYIVEEGRKEEERTNARMGGWVVALKQVREGTRRHTMILLHS
jgi:hypothetical protein